MDEFRIGPCPSCGAPSLHDDETGSAVHLDLTVTCAETRQNRGIVDAVEAIHGTDVVDARVAALGGAR